MKNPTTETTPLVVDLTASNGDSSLVLKRMSPQPDTIFVVKARNHQAATDYLQAALNPGALKPGGVNVLRPKAPGKWWVFGLFL